MKIKKLSKTDWFAGLAMQGLLANTKIDMTHNDVAITAYSMAEAMKKERQSRIDDLLEEDPVEVKYASWDRRQLDKAWSIATAWGTSKVSVNDMARAIEVHPKTIRNMIQRSNYQCVIKDGVVSKIS